MNDIPSSSWHRDLDDTFKKPLKREMPSINELIRMIPFIIRMVRDANHFKKRGVTPILSDPLNPV